MQIPFFIRFFLQRFMFLSSKTKDTQLRVVRVSLPDVLSVPSCALVPAVVLVACGAAAGARTWSERKFKCSKLVIQGARYSECYEKCYEFEEQNVTATAVPLPPFSYTLLVRQDHQLLLSYRSVNGIRNDALLQCPPPTGLSAPASRLCDVGINSMEHCCCGASVGAFLMHAQQ